MLQEMPVMSSGGGGGGLDTFFDDLFSATWSTLYNTTISIPNLTVGKKYFLIINSTYSLAVTASVSGATVDKELNKQTARSSIYGATICYVLTPTQTTVTVTTNNSSGGTTWAIVDAE